MLEVTSFGSGSSGNALLVRTTKTVLLVDCGVGVRRLVRGLESFGLSLADVDALLVSHEHSDHIRELPRFIAQRKTILSTKGSARVTNLPSSSWEEACTDRPVQIADAEILPIPVRHDAADPCGFLIRTPDGAVTVVTDLGSPCSAAIDAISESRLVVLEANHDEAMLRRGPYPARLQRRILSDTGHLSNSGCGELLVQALLGSNRAPTIWLAHLSETNNRPQLAKRTVERTLARAGLRLDVQTLPRREASETWRPDTAKVGVAQLSFDLAHPGEDGWGDRGANL